MRIYKDPYEILLTPIMTESVFDKLEVENKLVFNVHREATKHQIKKAIEELFEVKVIKINTRIGPDGTKRAFLRLAPNFSAMDVAMKLGMF